jgi:hypothetical protein
MYPLNPHSISPRLDIRVGIGVRPFVMASMVPGPFNDVILECNTVQQHQEHAQWETGFVGLQRGNKNNNNIAKA